MSTNRKDPGELVIGQGFRNYMEHKLWDAMREGRTYVDILADIIGATGYETQIAERSTWRRPGVADDHIDILATPRAWMRPAIKAKVISDRITVLQAAGLNRLLRPGEVGWLLTTRAGIDPEAADYAQRGQRLRLIDHDGFIDLWIMRVQDLNHEVMSADKD